MSYLMPASDDELQSLLECEAVLQATTVNLTAASNYLSPFVAGAMRAELNNIHCEGYPGRRYHQGQANADAIERLAVRRACELFGADHANVQPYRGTMANLAACLAVADPGDTILGFACDAGGHYTTGGSVHVTGRLFAVETYSVDPVSDLLDYDRIEKVAKRVKPRALFAGDTAYPGEWDWARMRRIADDVDAALVVDISQTAGLVIAGVVASPVAHADVVTMATYKTLRGPRTGLMLCTDEFAKRVDRAVHPVCQDGTNVQMLAGLAAALYEAAQPSYVDYCTDVLDNASVLADRLSDHGYELVTQSTTNHACLVDLTGHPLDGNGAAETLATANLICNANQIPFDSGPPARPSGLRLGTPAVTTLGMRAAEMGAIADFVHVALQNPDQPIVLGELADSVSAFRSGFEPFDRVSGLTVAGRGPVEAAEYRLATSAGAHA